MAQPDVLAERYGAPSSWRRRAVVTASVVVVGAFLGWLGWSIWGTVTPKVTSSLETWRVEDDHSVSAVVVVQLHDTGVRATCTVQALAEDHQVVGEVTFHPDPSRSRQEETIRTVRRASAVDLRGCTAPGQVHPR